MAIAKEKQETGSHEECINTAICTAIAPQSSRLFQSLLHCICSLFSTYPCLYMYIATFHSGSISIRYKSLLISAVAMGLSLPSGVTVRPTMAMRQAKHVAATSLCIACDLRGSNVANEGLTVAGPTRISQYRITMELYKSLYDRSRRLSSCSHVFLANS